MTLNEALDRITGKVGDAAFYDGITGLSPCTVVEIRGRDVVVDFDDDERVVHWSGMGSNPWRGRKGETFPVRRVVPALAVSEDGMRIAAYVWSKP